MDDKYFTSQSVELLRSQINPATYNPRTISKEGRAALKRSIKRYGVVGGIVVNKRTNYTIVGGHQKVSVLDELNKYPDNDYSLRVEVIDVDETTEKELNVTLNNPNVGGEWDADALRELIPDIDYKNTGLTAEDLEVIGVDFLIQTDEEENLAEELDNLMASVREEHQADLVQKQAERAEKVAHMKEVKSQVKSQAQERVQNMEAYVILSFDTFKAKKHFCEKFGFDPYEKFLKGEVFDENIEALLTE